MGFLGTIGNLISDGLGDKINNFADDIGLNRGGGIGGAGQSSNYLAGMEGGRGAPTAQRSSIPGAVMGAQDVDATGGNAMNMTPQQWDEQARQAGFRDANQMREWQTRQNAGKEQAQAQQQSLPQQILDRIGEGIRNVMGIHPKTLINRATDGLRQAQGD